MELLVSALFGAVGVLIWRMNQLTTRIDELEQDLDDKLPYTSRGLCQDTKPPL